MEVREATPADAGAIEGLAGGDLDAERLIHDRTVTVAEVDKELVGFIAYEAWSGAVHVTRLRGDARALRVLLTEPIRFGEREDLSVETIVPEDDEELEAALEDVGFERAAEGPRFGGRPSARFRYEE
ncbi:MAG: hypothetical protein ABEJ27_07760 [Halodesulfurarchaeum sp.]